MSGQSDAEKMATGKLDVKPSRDTLRPLRRWNVRALPYRQRPNISSPDISGW